MDRRRIRLRTIWSPPVRCDSRQPAASGRLLCAQARRFRLVRPGAGGSSNRGRLDHRDRGVHARQFPGVRATDDDGRGPGDQQVSLIYSMLMCVDGYVEDEHGRFAFAVPDEEVHSYVNQLTSSVGTYLYGRRMYETMVY